jgi:hypothetical protein
VIVFRTGSVKALVDEVFCPPQKRIRRVPSLLPVDWLPGLFG